MVNWDLLMNARGFPQRLYEDCLDLSRAGSGWQDFSTHAPFRFTRVLEGVGIPVRGSFDPATPAGSIAGTQPAMRFDNINRGARAIAVGSLGLRTAGGGAIVTGRIERTRTLFSRFGPAKPLLRIRRFTFQAAPFQRKGKDVADTFVMGLSGRATVLPAFARALSRIRCRGPHIVTSHPIRSGSQFGVVKLQLRPDVAIGIGGTFDIKNLHSEASSDAGDGPVTVTPSSIHVDLPSDRRTALRCEASYNCTPAVGTQFALEGSVVLSLGDRSTTLAGLSVTYVDSNGRSVPVVSGTLDGAPITVVAPYGVSADFDDRVAAALGAYSVRSDVDEVAAHFAKTAPP